MKGFLQSESGAVTVDWVVLSAAIVGLGIASVGAVSTGTGSLGDSIRDALRNASVANVLAYNPGSFNPNAMDGMIYWENPNNPMHAHWYQEGGDLRGWQSVHDPDYRLDIMEVRHHPWMEEALGPNGYAFDMIGRPGEHMNIQQAHDIAAGQTATVSFKVANHHNGTMNAYWGNELLGSFNPAVNQFESHSFQVTGGAGDGTNMLRFESTGGDGWRGVYLADVAVN